MIRIYNFTSGVRGLRVAWQCEEMGLAYEATAFAYPPPADYLAKYPPGSVPFLEDEGGVAMGESVAMMIYLAQRYGPTPLLPADPAQMGRVLQLMVASEAAMGGLMNPLMGTKFAAPTTRRPTGPGTSARPGWSMRWAMRRTCWASGRSSLATA